MARIDSTQLSVDEIRATVEEAEAANRYVAGHACTARAVNRALRAGVRSIEHGNLLCSCSVRPVRGKPSAGRKRVVACGRPGPGKTAC
ncbi:hypothetical protein ACF08M_33945 [Streptomyces sp. NPDC015032]|uniref:hypothetical protein n=1 Tax=Streptomyces sp. NPDC015032 TaxID=3364937 RepID=UPI003700D32F